MFDHLKAGSQDSSCEPTDGLSSLNTEDLRALREDLLQDSSAHALWVLKEIERFSMAFTEINTPQTPMPRFSWEQLERQLMFLAGTRERQAIVAGRVASIRRMSTHKPEEMILQEILIEAWVLLDEEPHAPLEEEDRMT